MIKQIKNNDSVAHVWCGQQVEPSQYYTIQKTEEMRWGNDSTLLTAIANGVAIVNDGSHDIPDVNTAVNYLKGNLPQEVTPTAPKNEYNLRPYGMAHKHIDASSLIYDITLTDKNVNQYTFSCATTPEYYDCIRSDHGQVRDGVLSIDGTTLTSFHGTLSNGAAKLSKPVNIDFEFPSDSQVYSLWGVYVSALDFGDDDVVRLQFVDDCGVGVAMGLYTQEEFDYMGGEVVLTEYDECWTRQLEKLGKVLTPDGAPAIVYAGIKARAKYYPSDPTKTDIKLWVDFIVTVKDEDL